MSTASPTSLQDLARAYGVATEYWDWRGNHVRVADATIEAVLGALDVDCSDPQAAVRAQQDEPWRRVLPPTVVLRVGWTPWVAVHVPDGEPLRAVVELEEGGAREVAQVDRVVEPREIDGRLLGEATLELPGDLPLGYHRLVVEHGDAGRAESLVVVTPERLELPAGLLERRAWGLMTQIYQVRSERSWGLGDVADLAELGAWGARQGADFVLVNPLHAAEPVAPMEPSPYLPTSRRFVNPMYIRVEEVPEIGYLSAAERQIVEWHADDVRSESPAQQLDRDHAWAAKDAALRVLFAQARSERRQRDFEVYCEHEGQGLLDYATWCAIAEDRGLPFTDWPEALRDPRSADVEAERERLARDVERHCWMQWVVHTQLADAQRELTAAGMSVGVVHDLAVGVHDCGADVWSLRDALARGVSVGAPPDDYNQLGQDWSQPPWRPDRLAELGYQPYRDMLRSTLQVSGGLRIDHVLGLFRLWWVPRGELPITGTYVRYDHEAMIGILLLEAHRAGAVIIGEDLGTVEDWVRDYLTSRGLLGTSILWFEREEDSPSPRAPETYRELCLASVTTHDLPPSAGYLRGEHLRVRQELGLLTRSMEEETAEDTAQRQAVLDELHRRNLLRPDAEVEEQVIALHRFLTFSPARMLGVAVPDLVGDVRTINQPGTDEEYPNWRLPLSDAEGVPVSLEQLMASRRAKRLVRAVTRRQPR